MIPCGESVPSCFCSLARVLRFGIVGFSVVVARNEQGRSGLIGNVFLVWRVRQKFDLIKRVDRGRVTTLKDLES